MSINKRYIITAALPYTNGNLHIGHLSGVFIPADIYARYLRSIKKKIIFISGSDEHGASILIKSIKKKTTPIKIINKYHNNIKKSLKKFNITLDNYYRTSKKLHHKYSLKVFNKLNKKNFFKKKITYQYYDDKYNQFLADRFVIGICPFCKYNFAYSDICEKCGSILNVGDLISPISILSNKVPILKKTLNLFISFKKYKKLLNRIYIYFLKNKYNKKIINYIKFFFKKGLFIDRSITRDLNWGIKIPLFNNKKVLYVWFEAILGYITSTINWSKKKKKKWQLYWKNKNTKLINFIGKDNIVFHSIFYPIIIKNYNKKYILPYYVNVNEFLKLEGNKISTSKNKAIFINKFINYFPNLIDSLRYTLIINMPINKDSNFTFQNFKKNHNTELIGILGNYFNRVIILLYKYCNGYIPYNICLNKYQKKILKFIYKYPIKIGNLIKKFKFKLALKKFINLASIGNKYLSKKEPWKIKNKNKINNILYLNIQIMLKLTKLSYYFLPNTYKKLLYIMNIKKDNLFFLNKKFKFFKKKKIKKNILLFKKINNDYIKYIKKKLL